MFKGKKFFIIFLAFQLPTETYDEYPWMNCNSFEATRKNCPRGEACLKLKQYRDYAWSWAMKCKFHNYLTLLSINSSYIHNNIDLHLLFLKCFNIYYRPEPRRTYSKIRFQYQQS